MLKVGKYLTFCCKCKHGDELDQLFLLYIILPFITSHYSVYIHF